MLSCPKEPTGVIAFGMPIIADRIKLGQMALNGPFGLIGFQAFSGSMKNSGKNLATQSIAEYGMVTSL